MSIPTPIQNAIQAYYAERATPEDIAALEDWLREDAAHVRIFAELGMFEWQMLCEQEKADAAAVMATLREAEEDAEADLVTLHHFPELSEDRACDPAELSVLGTYATYLCSDRLRSKMIKMQAVAATILLGLLLYLVFSGPGHSPTPSDTAENMPGVPSVDPISVVATLTGERDATWVRRPGDDLYTGQRFTLVEGFAEITTADGAVAVLEAPATIELTDSENALILYAGKLIGICETESSKGFLVRTPHMDITDLGTRFGVDADDDATIAHVFEGEVQAKISDAPVQAEPIALLANQSASRSIDTDVITRIDSAEVHFASILPESEHFFVSTGQGLGVSDIDPAWRIIQIDGKDTEQPIAMRVFDDPPTRTFGPLEAKWIGIKTNDLRWDRREIHYTIQTQVEIPDSIEMIDSTSLLLRFHSDDMMSSLSVNGQKIDVPVNNVMRAEQVYEIRITDHLVRGINEISLGVTDRDAPHQKNNYAGIRASLKLITRQTLFEGSQHNP